MTIKNPPHPVVLCILDGWGEAIGSDTNSIALAHKPNWDRFLKTCPVSTLEASEMNVGLPDGQMGNSEVGHMNIGAGRVVMQELPRIDQAVADGSIAKTPGFIAFVETLKNSGGTAHVIGLLSPGGVHSHQTHFAGIVRFLADAGVAVAIHPFLDGRDTPPKSALGYLDRFAKDMAGAKAAIATVTGRFYAMDRDNRWDRVAAAYDAIVAGQGSGKADDAQGAVQAAYEAGLTDEFVKPTVIGSYGGIKNGDGLFMINFRADRAREILTALLDPVFDKFERQKTAKIAAALGMVEYSTELKKLMSAVFGPNLPTQTFGEIVSKAGLHQLRIAETEKYPHVTYFFNGGAERVFEGEERILVPSPKVATYDLQPEMSSEELTDKLVEAIDSDRFDVVVVNYANADMVGHSGEIGPTVKAIEAVDRCLGRIAEAIDRSGGTMLITADHGNAEQMVDPVTGAPHTAHTTNPVPVILVNAPKNIGAVDHGKLADIAPTMLHLLGLPQPEVMTGHSLLELSQR